MTEKIPPRRDSGRRFVLWAMGTSRTRGPLPRPSPTKSITRPRYLAGVYNRLGAEVSGRTVENESLVNAPNWLCLSVRAEGGQWLGDEGNEILSHHQELEMYRGLLVRRTRWRDSEGRVTSLTQRRFVSMRDPHLAGLQTTVVPENWAGRIEVRSALDGTVSQQRRGSLPVPGFGPSDAARGGSRRQAHVARGADESVSCPYRHRGSDRTTS